MPEEIFDKLGERYGYNATQVILETDSQDSTEAVLEFLSSRTELSEVLVDYLDGMANEAGYKSRPSLEEALKDMLKNSEKEYMDKNQLDLFDKPDPFKC